MAILARSSGKLLRCTKAAFSTMASVESDVVVIGGGRYGCAAAIKAARLGLKTTCIHNQVDLGGNIPLKILQPSEAKLQPKIDLHMCIARREKATSCLTKSINGIFTKNQVNYIKGTGRFVSPSQVYVDTLEGGNIIVKGKRIIIATGSHFKSSFTGIDDKKVMSSSGAFSLAKIPKKAVLIGASYVSLEVGSMWARLGSEVVVVDTAPVIVQSMDGEIRKKFQSMLVHEKVEFILETKVVSVDSSLPSGVRLTIQPVTGGPQRTIEADVILVPERRVPNTDGLRLENIGIQNDSVISKGGIQIYKRFSTGVPGVYAIGDVVTTLPNLASHRTGEDAATHLDLIIGDTGEVLKEFDTVPGVKPDLASMVPGVIYTYPEVASFGLTEEQVKVNGHLEYSVRRIEMEDSAGIMKLLAEKKTNKVLGVHILSPNASEKICRAAFALRSCDRDAEEVVLHTTGKSIKPHREYAEIYKRVHLV